MLLLYVDLLPQNRNEYKYSFKFGQDDELVGGLYSVQIGRVFCGESMFAKVSNASKAGFITFALRNQNEIDLIDCQVHTSHLESFGARMISKSAFLHYLNSDR